MTAICYNLHRHQLFGRHALGCKEGLSLSGGLDSVRMDGAGTWRLSGGSWVTLQQRSWAA